MRREEGMVAILVIDFELFKSLFSDTCWFLFLKINKLFFYLKYNSKTNYY